MNRKFFVILAIAAVAGIVGCNKNDNKTTVSDGKIKIVTGIDPIETRVPQLGEDGSGSFADGDAFTIVAFGATGKSAEFGYSVGYTDLYWNDVENVAADGKVSFAACYPVQEISNGLFSFDLSTAKYKDLLLASVKDVTVGSADPVKLKFGHAMHRLVIKYSIDASSNVSAADIVTVCNAKSSCKVDMLSGSLDSSESSKSQFEAEGGNVSFMLVPQACSDVEISVKAGEASTTFTVDEKTDVYENLESGKQLTLTLKVKADKIEIGDAEIDGWGDQGTVDGEIIM